MAFPAQSTALSGDAGSLWWQTTWNGQAYNCAGQGNTVIEQLQKTLNVLAPAGGPPTGASTPVFDPTYTPLAIDRKLGAKTLTAMFNMLRQMASAPQWMLDDISADWRNGSANPNSTEADAFSDINQGSSIRFGTMVAALWISQHRDLDSSALTVPEDIITFEWGREPPSDGTMHGRDPLCWKQGDPTPIELGGTDPTTPTTIPEGNWSLGAGGVSSSSSTPNWVQSVTRVVQGQSTGSQTMDIVIPLALAAVGVGAIALIVVATKDRKKASHHRRLAVRRSR
jgi:hypothetical protein